MCAAVLTARLAGAGTRPQRLVDDRLDGPRAASAFGTAAKAAIDLLGIAGQLVSRADGVADIVIANDVAGTHNHRTDQPSEDRASSIVKRAWVRKRKTRLLKRFQTATQPGMNLSSGAGGGSQPRPCGGHPGSSFTAGFAGFRAAPGRGARRLLADGLRAATPLGPPGRMPRNAAAMFIQHSRTLWNFGRGTLLSAVPLRKVRS